MWSHWDRFLLILLLQPPTAAVPLATSSSGNSIVGIVVGCLVAGVIILGLALFFFVRTKLRYVLNLFVPAYCSQPISPILAEIDQANADHRAEVARTKAERVQRRNTLWDKPDTKSSSDTEL